MVADGRLGSENIGHGGGILWGIRGSIDSQGSSHGSNQIKFRDSACGQAGSSVLPAGPRALEECASAILGR